MKAKVFVKVNEYEQLSAHLENIVGRLKNAKKLLDDIADLKSQEDVLLQEWSDELSEVEEKVEQIDNTLIEHENE